MNPNQNRIMAGLAIAFVVCFLAVDFAEAGRRGGGGGRGMSRGGPASSGSFQRSRARPQRSPSTQRDRSGTTRGTRDYGANQGSGDRQDRRDQGQDNRQDRRDQGQDNRQDRFDQRQDNLDERQDFRKEVHNDRKEYYNDRNEWYEDQWRRGSYVTVYSWNGMGCRYDPVLVGTNTYYECRGVRYERVYRGGDVVYIVVP